MDVSSTVKVAALAACLSMTACLKTRNELGETEEKKVVQTQVQTLQKQKAEAEAQTMQLEAQYREQNGRIETLERAHELAFRAREEQTQKVAALEARIKTLEEGILQLSQELEAAKAAPPPAPKKEAKESVAGGPFEEGEQLFGDKEWKKAIAAYQKYREANPKGEHVAAATYKIGVCLQELKMNKEARVFFEEVIERFPKSKPARAATFRLSQLKKKNP